MTDDKLKKTSWDTIVIGGGQAGLVTGYYLKKLKVDFVILDAHAITGDSWRRRWDSLRLFTPNWLNSLPGMPFPAGDEFPSKDAVADYLISYKEAFDLPVQNGCHVIGLNKTTSGYQVTASDGIRFAASVVIATGNYTKPKIPAFAKTLDRSTKQVHSSNYLNSSQLPDGDILVVGAGTSGLQIALDLVQNKRKVYVAGKPPGHIPDLIFKYFAKQFVWFATNILNTSTPIGRKAGKAFKSGQAAPLINITLHDVIDAGATHLPRIVETNEGWPVSADGRQLKVANIIWATGFTPDYSWVKINGCFDDNGYPLTTRGISNNCEGMYFIGSAFQYGLTSAWLGGVARDADFICQDLSRFVKQKLKSIA